MVNRAFLEIMIEGDANGRGFQYPIPTYSITRDFDWSETENNKLLFEMTAKYGTPYFSNYINSDMEPSDVRSMCCRLRLDLRELRKKSGGFFGSGESTGSAGSSALSSSSAALRARRLRASSTSPEPCASRIAATTWRQGLCVPSNAAQLHLPASRSPIPTRTVRLGSPSTT